MATEYISRETVLKYVKDWSCGYDYIETKGAINDIKAITAADVRPVVLGKWVSVHDGYGICSNCHRGDHVDPLARFCRFCGADMREVLDDGKTT